MPTAGAAFTCVLLDDGTVHCWGEGAAGQTGIQYRSPTTVPGLPSARQISGEGVHTCAVTAEHEVWCWGGGPLELGFQPTPDTPDPDSPIVAPPRKIPGLRSNNTFVATASDYACAVGDDGAVRCFGWVPAFGKTYADGPLTIAGFPPDVVTLTAAVDHSCAIDRQGTAWCWGLADAQTPILGDGTLGSSITPVRVQSPVAFTHLTAGDLHTCGIDTNHDVWCWGKGGYLGDGTGLARAVPTRVVGLSGATDLAASGYQTCAVLSDGTVWCWGMALVASLNPPPGPALSLTPSQIPGLGHAVAVGVSPGHACAIVADGTVWCWGYNDVGQLGTAASNDYVTTPVRARW